MAKNNRNFHKAMKVKNNEFFTQLSDVEKELYYYKSYFKNKVVLCNCGDTKSSAFWTFFSLKFIDLGLKKLIAVSFNKDEQGEVLILTNAISKPKIIKLKGSGDFKSEEMIRLLKQSDIVVTNPPFSEFRAYISQLLEYKKKFLVIANQNCASYKEIIKEIQSNKLWFGVTKPTLFLQSDNALKKYGNICWATNLSHKHRKDKLTLFQNYKSQPKAYPKYDNFPAIEVSQVVNIPEDYNGVMGVPVTFLDKYNPEQFEIIGIDRYVKGNTKPGKRMMIKGIERYARILIKRRIYAKSKKNKAS